MSKTLFGNSQTTGTLSGQWETSTIPINSGHLVNKGYLDFRLSTGSNAILPPNLITGIGFQNYIPKFNGTSGLATGNFLFDSNGNIICSAGGIYSIGTFGGSNNPYSVWLTGPCTASAFQWNNQGAIFTTANGVVEITDNGANDFNRLMFGGPTNAYPALRRIGSSLGVKLADDTAYTHLQARNFTGSGFYSGATNIGDLFYPRNINPSGYLTGINFPSGTAISITGSVPISGIINIQSTGSVFISVLDNTITISGVASTGTSGGVSFSWSSATGNITGVSNNGYIINGNNIININLPLSSAVGDVVKIAGRSTSGWKINQNNNNIIYFGNTNTISGASGYLQSTHQRDCIELLCLTNSTEWQVVNSVGNITIN